MSGGEVVVELGSGMKGFGIGPAWISFGRTPQVGVRIRCPEGSDVDLATASADLMARGRLGEVEAKSASGDLHVDDVADLRFHTASGDVRANLVDGEARCRPCPATFGSARFAAPLPRRSSRATSPARKATRTWR